MIPKFGYFDIHSHIHDVEFDHDRDEVVGRMQSIGMGTIAVGTDKTMSERAIVSAQKYSNVWATIGQHPVDKPNEQFDTKWYQEQAKHPRVVAIGECGLDYYWPTKDGWKDGEAKEKERQRILFRAQIELAALVNKPLMIHGRPAQGSMDAYLDIITEMKEAQKEFGEAVRGNIHFFVGTIEIAKQFLELGFTMSFTGVVTFTQAYDEVIRFLPLEQIMAETDAPYVSPVPYRGMRNEPGNVRAVVERVASIRAEDQESVARTLVMTAMRSFSLSP